FFFQAEDGIRDRTVTGVQTCALPIFNHLRTVRRAEIADRIHRVRAESRPQNDAEYEDAKNEQSLVEGRIIEIEALLANAVLIERSEERRVGKECRCGRAPGDGKQRSE